MEGHDFALEDLDISIKQCSVNSQCLLEYPLQPTYENVESLQEVRGSKKSEESQNVNQSQNQVRLPSLNPSNRQSIHSQTKQSVPRQTTRQRSMAQVNAKNKSRTLPKSVMTRKRGEVQDEPYLPKFIREFKLPPKSKVQILPTMTVFKFRQQKIAPLLSDREQLKNYSVVSNIGKGSFSVVSLATSSQDKRKYAIKTYPKFDQIEPYKFDNIMREIENMKVLRGCQNIVGLSHALQDQRKILLVMENAGQKSLAGMMRKEAKFKEAKAKDLFRQIIEGISQCHERNICHRDLKLENILVNEEGVVKIIDFGFSATADKSLSSFCGTPPYMAPEVVSRKPYDGKATDIWAVGVILYVLVYGKYPFASSNETELYRLIQQGKPVYRQEISHDLKELLQGMIRCKTSERLTVDQIKRSQWLVAA